MLQTELQCIQERHLTGKKIFDSLGASLPAFGMVGTLIGLIQMLGALDDPTKIGAGMAVAMVTTFYGAFVANMFYLPMAGKLETRSKEETLIRELTIQGLLALMDGESPKVIETRLYAFLSPKNRAGRGGVIGRRERLAAVRRTAKGARGEGRGARGEGRGARGEGRGARGDRRFFEPPLSEMFRADKK